MSFGSFSLRELTCMHCVYLALWTRKVLCGRFLCAIYINFHSFIHSLCPLLQTSTPDLTPVLMPYSTHLDQNHFLMMEIVTWNIPLSNGKTENSLLGVWFWGSVSHFRSRPFVTGSYASSVLSSSISSNRPKSFSGKWLHNNVTARCRFQRQNRCNSQQEGME